MKYFKNPENKEVYAYALQEQQSLIDDAISNGWEDITGSWPVKATSDNLKENCKYEAKYRLMDTDFSQTLDVAAVLVNKAEFDAYRATVRQLFITPVENPTWPDKPSAEWALNINP